METTEATRLQSAVLPTAHREGTCDGSRRSRHSQQNPSQPTVAQLETGPHGAPADPNHRMRASSHLRKAPPPAPDPSAEEPRYPALQIASASSPVLLQTSLRHPCVLELQPQRSRVSQRFSREVLDRQEGARHAPTPALAVRSNPYPEGQRMPDRADRLRAM